MTEVPPARAWTGTSASEKLAVVLEIEAPPVAVAIERGSHRGAC